jgi:hypothetical protein
MRVAIQRANLPRISFGVVGAGIGWWPMRFV